MPIAVKNDPNILYHGGCEWCGKALKQVSDYRIIQGRYISDIEEKSKKTTIYTRLCKDCADIYYKLGSK